MPEIKVEIAKELPKPVEGGIYTIQTVESFTSQKRSYTGLRILMNDQNNQFIGETLWTREVAGPRSKIGAFITLLGTNTDNWIGKRIRFVEWREGNRKIEMIQ